jgi:hypothetical protein
MAKRNSTQVASAHPFLFYGAAPGSWYGDESHPYEIRFRHPTDAAARAKAGDLIERHLRRGKIRATPLEPWLWSAQHLLCSIEITHDAAARWKPVHQLLVALHELLPIDQVICLEVEEESTKDAWTAWSKATRPRPAPGPSHAVTFEPYERDDDPALPPYAEDPVFESARFAVRTESHRAALARHKGPVTAELIDPGPALASGMLEEQGGVLTIDGPGWRIELDTRGGRTLYRVHDGARTAAFAELGYVHHVAPHPRGFWASTGGGDFGKIPPRLFRVEMPSGAVIPVCELERTQRMNLMIGVDEHRVLLASHAVFLFDTRRDPPLVGRLEQDLALRCVAGGGQLALAQHLGGKPASHLLRLKGDGIEVIGSVPIGFRHAAEIDGAIFGFVDGAAFRVRAP